MSSSYGSGYQGYLVGRIVHELDNDLKHNSTVNSSIVRMVLIATWLRVPNGKGDIISGPTLATKKSCFTRGTRLYDVLQPKQSRGEIVSQSQEETFLAFWGSWRSEENMYKAKDAQDPHVGLRWAWQAVYDIVKTLGNTYHV